MLFHSIQFLYFFLVIYASYLSVRYFFGHKWENRLLLIVSYIFYIAWDWRFLGLIILSTLVDFFCGKEIYVSQSKKRKKIFLFISVFTNLGLLGFFKYFNFFADSLVVFLGELGLQMNFSTLNIILPIGISFYTFQTLSYTIDIFKGKLKPVKNIYDFGLFVAFFPQLVAGPIERATKLLPQIQRSRDVGLEKIYEGTFLIFWGIFLKIFISDNLVKIVDPVFASPNLFSTIEILIAVYAFAIQIYCDFAGYTNMARGLAKYFGFELSINFNLPYFSLNPQEFWKKWHITLSSWFRDYLYIPLGGNRRGKARTFVNLFVTMILCGLWHGAAWTFVIWGVYHSLILVAHRLLRNSLGIVGKLFEKFSKNLWLLFRIFIFFQITCFGWLIFRSENIENMLVMLKKLFIYEHAKTGEYKIDFFYLMFFVFFLAVIQVWQYRKKDLMVVYRSGVYVRVLFYTICLSLLMLYGFSGTYEFIYFQF